MARNISLVIAALAAASLVAGALYYKRSRGQRDDMADWNDEPIPAAESEQPVPDPVEAVPV